MTRRFSARFGTTEEMDGAGLPEGRFDLMRGETGGGV